MSSRGKVSKKWEPYPDPGSGYEDDEIGSDVEEALLQQFHYASVIEFESNKERQPTLDSTMWKSSSNCEDSSIDSSSQKEALSVTRTKKLTRDNSLGMHEKVKGRTNVAMYFNIDSDDDGVLRNDTKSEKLDVNKERDDALEREGKGGGKKRKTRIREEACMISIDTSYNNNSSSENENDIVHASNASNDIAVVDFDEDSNNEEHDVVEVDEDVKVNINACKASIAIEIPTMVNNVLRPAAVDEQVADTSEYRKKRKHAAADGSEEDAWQLEPEDIYTLRGKSRYWVEKDDQGNEKASASNARCFICNDRGHQSRECPNRDVMVCLGCGNVGHHRLVCPLDVCYNCMKFGHRMADCREPSVRGHVHEPCQRCKRKGHRCDYCPELYKRYLWTQTSGTIVPITSKNTTKWCSNCGEEGHLIDECIKISTLENRYVPSRANVEFYGNRDDFYRVVLKIDPLVLPAHNGHKRYISGNSNQGVQGKRTIFHDTRNEREEYTRAQNSRVYTPVNHQQSYQYNNTRSNYSEHRQHNFARPPQSYQNNSQRPGVRGNLYVDSMRGGFHGNSNNGNFQRGGERAPRPSMHRGGRPSYVVQAAGPQYRGGYRR